MSKLYTPTEKKELAINSLARKIKEYKSLVNYWHSKTKSAAPEWIPVYEEKLQYGKQHLYHLLKAHETVNNTAPEELQNLPIFISNYN